jgi:hypothetical protein
MVSGQTYTIKFDFKSDAANPVSSVDVGFASAFDWSGATLAQPAVSVSGFSSSAFTTKTVTITATSSATVYLALKLNWAGQPAQEVNSFIKNVSTCNGNTGVKISATDLSSVETVTVVSYGANPNPFEEATALTISDATTTPMKLTVSALSGKILYESNVHRTNEEITIGTELSPGMYIVQANYLGKVVTFRIVKQ